MHRVIASKGLTSAVLAVDMAHNEEPAEIGRVLLKRLTPKQLLQVHHIATDNPSGAVLRQLQQAVPGLVYRSLDPMHICMHYEEAQGRTRTSGSRWLRMAMHNVTCVGETMGHEAWGGGGGNSWDLRALQLRMSVAPWSASRINAIPEKLLQTKDQPWYERSDLIYAVASISSLVPDDMCRRRKSHVHNTRRMVWSSMQIDRVEWLFNSMRYAHTLSRSLRLMRPTGTTANEALHFELNGACHRVQVFWDVKGPPSRMPTACPDGASIQAVVYLLSIRVRRLCRIIFRKCLYVRPDRLSSIRHVPPSTHIGDSQVIHGEPTIVLRDGETDRA